MDKRRINISDEKRRNIFLMSIRIYTICCFTILMFILVKSLFTL